MKDPACRIGFSLRDAVFLGRPDKRSPRDLIAHYRNTEQFLEDLKAAGVGSIELRVLPRYADAQLYCEVIEMIWQLGFELTVHGEPSGGLLPAQSFTEAYPSLAYILHHFHRYQSGVTIAIHALDGMNGSFDDYYLETVRLLRHWGGMIAAEEWPVTMALENNRKKGSRIDPGNSLDGVLRLVQEIDSPHVAITWDMGHSYANLIAEQDGRQVSNEALTVLPTTQFLERVRHTHIHGLGLSGTHNPLTGAGSLPLELYVDALHRAGYRGAYQLELDMDKFPQDQPLDRQVFSSIERLRRAVRRFAQQ